MFKINNTPASLNNYRFIVATKVDNELWYWGEFDEKEKAYEVASKIGDGVVVEKNQNEPVESLTIDERMNLIYNSLEREYKQTKRGTFTKQMLELDMMFLDKMLTEN